jgi:hypothetical protein
LDTLLPCTESHDNIKVTVTVVRPQEILCVSYAFNAAENCDVLKNGFKKNFKLLRPSVRVATVKSYDIMKVKNALKYKLDHGVRYLQSYFSNY